MTLSILTMFCLYILAGIAIFLTTWVLFMIVMRVKNLPKPYVYIFLPIGIVGWIGDVLFNVFWATLIFKQWPDIHKEMRIHDITLSHRLRQILRHDTSIREGTARWDIASTICRYFIEPHDAPHCGRNEDKK